MNGTNSFGLEVKLQLNTSSKLFCACSSTYLDAPNRHLCPVCLAYPGALPSLNDCAVACAVSLSQALKAKIHASSIFERRLDYSPLFPKAYQISQHRKPLAEKGSLDMAEGVVPIDSIALEEDAAWRVSLNKMGQTNELIDYNRSGIALVRLITQDYFCEENQVQDFISRLFGIAEALKLILPSAKRGAIRYRQLDASQRFLLAGRIYLPEPDLGDLRLSMRPGATENSL